MNEILQTFEWVDAGILFSYFWENITLESFIKFAIFYFIVIWISLIIWVAKDITNRTNSLFFQIISILIILFLTPLWIFIYLLIRPSKTVFEKYYEEIEENLDTLSETIASHQFNCPACKAPVNTHFRSCPQCNHTLQIPCLGCGKLIFHEWRNCPHCGKKNKQKKQKK